MATASNFRVKNGLTVGSTSVIDSSGAWIGPQTNIVGSTGPQGAAGTAGSTGPQGTTGTAGANGPQGATGPQGASPTGRNGAQGSQGPTGPQGPSGPSGPQGSTGPQGASGSGGSLGTQTNALGVNIAAGPQGTLQATSTITAGFSDERLKNILGNIDEPSVKLNLINGIYFTQNKFAEKFGYNDYKKEAGVIAQEIKKVLPEIVSIAPFDIDENGNSKSGENYLTVDYEKIIPLLIETIKEHQKEIDFLNETIG